MTTTLFGPLGSDSNPHSGLEFNSLDDFRRRETERRVEDQLRREQEQRDRVTTDLGRIFLQGR